MWKLKHDRFLLRMVSKCYIKWIASVLDILIFFWLRKNDILIFFWLRKNGKSIFFWLQKSVKLIFFWLRESEKSIVLYSPVGNVMFEWTALNSETHAWSFDGHKRCQSASALWTRRPLVVFQHLDAHLKQHFSARKRKSNPKKSNQKLPVLSVLMIFRQQISKCANWLVSWCPMAEHPHYSDPGFWRGTLESSRPLNCAHHHTK